MTVVDARCLNWRFVLPGEPDGMVVLDQTVAARHSRVTDVLTGARWPAIVVPDLTVWSATVSPRRVLRDVAEAVAPGGWLCVGFLNRWFPGLGRGAIGLGAATATLEAAGLTATSLYLPLPDHRHPALLVDARHRGQLDYVFRHVFLTYLPGTSASTRASRRLLVAARRLAVVAPQPLRVRFAPAYYVIARRSA